MQRTKKILQSKTKINNKVLMKCEEERSRYIHRQLDDLIKKELKTFFLSKKFEKQVQDSKKDYVVMHIPTPLQRVKQFRQKQKQKSENLLGQLEKKQIKRTQKSMKKKQQMMNSNMLKAKENLSRIMTVRNNFQSIQKNQKDKLQNLKKTYVNYVRADSISSRKTAPISQDRKIQKRIMTAKQNNRRIEEEQINKYMNKMKTMQERSLKRELGLQKKIQQASLKVSQCNIAKRSKIQEELVTSWQNRYESTLSRFKKNRMQVISQKQKSLQYRSYNRSMMQETVMVRKWTEQQNLAKQRRQCLENKMIRIKKCPKRQNHQVSLSQSNFYRNIENAYVDNEKEQHNHKMHRIHEILQKLKSLDDQEKLSPSDINQLLENVDKNDPFYEEMKIYLNNTKDQFFQRKQKQEEQRAKKNKKLNQKML